MCWPELASKVQAFTFKKNKPSFLDLFFIEKPSEFISASEVVPAKKEKDPNVIVPGLIFDKKDEEYEYESDTEEDFKK